MKLLRKSLAVLIILALALALVPGGTRKSRAADVVYSESGRTSVKRLTMDQLKEKYSKIPAYDSLYATESVVTGSGYHPGVLTKQAYANALAWINYYRTSVGLTEVSFSNDYNLSASYGALLLAMGGVFSHYPPQPQGMSNEDYKKGYDATSSSNISYSEGYRVQDVLKVAVQGQMEDEDASNIYRVGHRRWLLNPDVLTLGVGTANNGAAYYTDIKVYDSKVKDPRVTDYDFIAWPASGDNLSDTFKRDTPWSISLNPSRYGMPERSKVQITLTRQSDGKVWTFDQNTEQSMIGPGLDYYTVSVGGIGSLYGSTYCIIFRPAYEDFLDYAGEYTVDVTGLTKSGKAADLHYKVNFGAVKDPSSYTYNVYWNWDSGYKAAQAYFRCNEDSGRSLYVKAEISQELVERPDYDCDQMVITATVVGPDGKTYQDHVTSNVYRSREILRLYGNTRYETSYLLADLYKDSWGGGKFSEVIVASGSNFPDALSGSYLAAKRHAPILMAGPKQSHLNKLVSYLVENLEENGLVYILGGKTAVSEELDALLQEKGIQFKRLQGKTRYDTNLEILKEAGVANYSSILVCTGKSYPDALSASAIGKPILMVNDNLTSAQKNYLAELGTCYITIVGGEKAVTPQVEKALKEYGYVSNRLAGKSRYETSVMLAHANFGLTNALTLAYGDNFPDGLCAGPLSYRLGAPVILTKTGSTNYAKAYYDSLISIRVCNVIGGPTLISDDAVRSILSMKSDEEIREVTLTK